MMKALLSLVAGCALGGWAWAESAEPGGNSRVRLPDPHLWTIQLYGCPGDALTLPGGNKPLPLPSLPPVDASGGEIIRFLKESNALLRKCFEGMGGPLPEGFLAASDPVNGTLAVRAPWEAQDFIHSMVQPLCGKGPSLIRYHLHVVEAEGAELRSIMKEALRDQNHRALWQRAQALIAEGSAHEVSTLLLETRSGQRALTSQGVSRRYANGFSLSNSGLLEVSHADRGIGTQFEADPVIGPDNSLTDLSFTLDHDFAPPVERWVHLNPAEGKRLDCQMTDFFAAKVTAAITARSGTVKLLGVWAPEGAGPESAGHLQAAFLTVDVVSTDPPLNDRVLQLLQKYGEQAVPMPKEIPKPADPKSPSGMEQRDFMVPPDFLTATGAGGRGVDPFVPPPAPQPPADAARRPEAVFILEQAGIPFPEGASAIFNAASSTMKVTNLPENLDLVEAFLTSLADRDNAAMLALTLHIVQADAKLLRELVAKGRQSSDQAGALNALEEAVRKGEAKFVSSAWLETRSGQRCELESGIQYMTASPPHLERSTAPQTSPAAGNGDPFNAPAAAANAAPTPAAAVAEIAAGSRDLTAKHQTTCAGLTFEVDPVIGPDSVTIDLSFALNYHYAPPQLRQEASPTESGSVLQAALPVVDFHQGKVTTSVTMRTGTTRLVGIWKPEGTPEFEKADVLQAAFLRADVVYVDGPPRKR